LRLSIAVTGMHLAPEYGMTVRDIEATGLPIAARIPIDVQGRSGEAMSRAIGQAIVGLTDALAKDRPDLVLVIGDRGEMLAGAIAALHLGIPVVHLHGGERSGTVDESVRHAITKLSHWHFVATEESRERVVRLGEQPQHVHVTGAPSLDDVAGQGARPREETLALLGLPAGAEYLLVLFHPIVQEAAHAQTQTQALADAVQQVAKARNLHVVWLAPNADAGSAAILQTLDQSQLLFTRITHLPRPDFLAALGHAKAFIGNSSAGIIEAASLGTPVVNVGNRQRARERNANTRDCGTSRDEIVQALEAQLARGPFSPGNRYGDGQSGARIARLLATLPIEPTLLDKINTF
jgi:GDP/UDP-N,N'-diacetylbacillosamine 2-epimerase (hydrolysing)